MKGIVYLFFGMIAGVVSARGQGPLTADNKLVPYKLHLAVPSTGQDYGFLPQPDTSRVLASTPEGPVRTLKPDNMPCLVPPFSRVERMPIRRSGSRDPMPVKK